MIILWRWPRKAIGQVIFHVSSPIFYRRQRLKTASTPPSEIDQDKKLVIQHPTTGYNMILAHGLRFMGTSQDTPSRRGARFLWRQGNWTYVNLYNLCWKVLKRGLWSERINPPQRLVRLFEWAIVDVILSRMTLINQLNSTWMT
jgi:hypothetical protein